MKSVNNPKHCKCGSLGCIHCRELTQTSFASETERFLWNEPAPALLTAVPLDGLVPVGGIMEFDLKAFVRRHRVKLARRLPPNVTFFGAVDFSLNLKGNIPLYWSFHYHAVLNRELTIRELKKLKVSYPIKRKSGIYKPVQVKPINEDSLNKTAAYVYKSFFQKRSQYLAKPKSGRNPYLNSCDLPMNKQERESLDTFLNQYKVTDSIILIGVKKLRSSCAMDIRFKATK